MIKKLRTTFIVLAMCSVLLVLILLIGSINVVNYHGVIKNADAVLAVLEENDGRFPKVNEKKEHDFGKAMSPELPYESRFFSVLLDEEGRVIFVDTGKIAAVDTETAIVYAQKIWSEGKEKGFIGDYRYTRLAAGRGSRMIFLDCGRNLATFRRFLAASCGISLLGLCAVFLLIFLFSGWIIRPVSESYEKQKRFITDAGHEIKTPLTIIDADAEILKMEVGENEWLQDIKKQTRRLAELTNDLVYLSRMEEGQPLPMVDFPVSDVIAETAQSFQVLARTQNKAFDCEIQPMLSLHGDEKAIRQLVSILLDNALKYSEEGGEISLRLERQGRSLRLTAANTTGAVLTKEELGHLFDRFYRTDPSRNSETGGYGIGLSIARAIVTAHRGRIAAAMEQERRIVITVTLPAAVWAEV